MVAQKDEPKTRGTDPWTARKKEEKTKKETKKEIRAAAKPATAAKQ